VLEDADLFVISPGISLEAPFVEKVNEKNIPIWGEIELANYYNKGVIAAITGTNGKTTTTTLVGEIFKYYQKNYLNPII
jgi:UDP-N-acetylmuramoylalanine--D-glutamate ligase